MKEEIKKPVKIKFQQKVAYDMSELYLSPKSVLHCAKCQSRLGILHTLRHALFKPQGSKYHVSCKRCGYQNLRIKGEYKQTVTKRWSDLQRDLDAKRKL